MNYSFIYARKMNKDFAENSKPDYFECILIGI